LQHKSLLKFFISFGFPLTPLFYSKFQFIFIFLFSTGYHNCWNQRVGFRHPSLWTFIRHMKDAQAELEASFDAIANCASPPTSRLKWRRMEARINQLKRQYNRGQRRLKDYWRAVCHVIQ
jgi:hypothetical protein